MKLSKIETITYGFLLRRHKTKTIAKAIMEVITPITAPTIIAVFDPPVCLPVFPFGFETAFDVGS